ncbi:MULTISPECIES: C1 family peptidase [Paenibacillus]
MLFLLLVGYKKINGKIYAIVRKSWGVYWGDKGYFYLPQGTL